MRVGHREFGAGRLELGIETCPSGKWPEWIVSDVNGLQGKRATARVEEIDLVENRLGKGREW